MITTRLLRTLAVLAALAAAGCDPAEEPSLCVFTAEELQAAGGDPESSSLCSPKGDGGEEKDAPACEGFAVSAGDVFFVRHTLPSGVASPGKLEIHLTTPCATADPTADVRLEVEHADRVALVSLLAPVGSDCSLAVTATIANSELRCDSVLLDAARCADLKAVCEPPADGAGSGQ